MLPLSIRAALFPSATESKRPRLRFCPRDGNRYDPGLAALIEVFQSQRASADFGEAGSAAVGSVIKWDSGEEMRLINFILQVGRPGVL